MTLLQFALAKGKAARIGIMTRSIVIFTYIFQVVFTDDKGNRFDISKSIDYTKDYTIDYTTDYTLAYTVDYTID